MSSSLVKRLAVAASGMCLLMSSLSFGARAESPELPDPNYHNLRYLDDFSHPDPNNPPDIWDSLKHIPMDNGPLGASYLSMGGELRERLEYYNHVNFGIGSGKVPNYSTYDLHRLLINADLHLTDYFRTFVQFGELDRVGRRGVASSTDIDRGEFMQAFVDVNLPGPVGDTVTARYGREEMLFGFQRLIAVREGPNVRRAFDGYRFTEHIGEATVDVFRVRPVFNGPKSFDDESNTTQLLNGVYVTVPVGKITKADVYWLGYENDAGKYRGQTGREERDTFGVRIFNRTSTWDWNLEASRQTGSFAAKQYFNVDAKFLAGIVGYSFKDVTWQPRLAVSANYASGDQTSNKTTIGTFNAMYPRLPYFAETSMLVPANVKDIRGLLELHPVTDVMTVFGYDRLWRVSTTDGLYGSAMTLYAETNLAKVKGDLVGQEITSDTRWQVDQHLQLGFIAAEFLSGPAVKEALGKNVTFLVGYAKYRF